MKLKFRFFKKTKIYVVTASLFMAGGKTVLFKSTNKKLAKKSYKKYSSSGGDPYEIINLEQKKKFLKAKKL